MTQTINAMTSILGEAETTYGRGTTEINRAIEKFATEKAKLFRGDGTAIYQDAVYDEKLAAITAELHATADRVGGQAEAQIVVVNRLQESGYGPSTCKNRPQSRRVRRAATAGGENAGECVFACVSPPRTVPFAAMHR